MNRSHRGLDGSLFGNWGVTWTGARGTADSGLGREAQVQVQVQVHLRVGQGLEGEAQNSPKNYADQGSYHGG